MSRLKLLTLLGLLTAASSCSWPERAPRGPIVVDTYGSEALALLREATERVQLGKTTLKDVAPHLHVPEGAGNLEWQDALVRAGKQFGADPLRKAVFLRKNLKAGQPASALNEITEFLRVTPIGQTCSVWCEVYDEAGREKRVQWAGSAAKGRHRESKPPEPPVGVQCFTSGTKDGVLTGPPHLYVQGLTVNGRFFGQLGFDATDRLNFFAMRGAPDGKKLFWASGELCALGRPPKYWVTVRKGAASTWFDEARDYDENLLLHKRTVYAGAFDFDKRLYAEHYVKGILYKRVHYGKNSYGHNSRVSQEWFPLPRPDVLDEATLDKIVTEALDPEAHSLGERAWDLLPLAGGRAVPVISKHLRTAVVPYPEHWVHLLSEIASPEAVRLLLWLLDRDDVSEYCRPGGELIRRWETSRPAIVEAVKSPKASARVKRFCVEVMGLSNDATVVPVLAEALKQEETCSEAAWALVNMDCPEAQAAIREAAKSHLPHVRRAIEGAVKAREAF